MRGFKCIRSHSSQYKYKRIERQTHYTDREGKSHLIEPVKVEHELFSVAVNTAKPIQNSKSLISAQIYFGHIAKNTLFLNAVLSPWGRETKGEKK